MTWRNIGNYDRDPEGKVNPSAEIGKGLSHFARQEPWSLVSFREQSGEDVGCLPVGAAVCLTLARGASGWFPRARGAAPAFVNSLTVYDC